MDADTRANVLNQLLVKTFAEFGATGPMIRMILLKDHFFIGQRFQCEGLQAMFLAGGNEIEFRDQTGVLLKTVSLEEGEKKTAA